MVTVVLNRAVASTFALEVRVAVAAPRGAQGWPGGVGQLNPTFPRFSGVGLRPRINTLSNRSQYFFSLCTCLARLDLADFADLDATGIASAVRTQVSLRHERFSPFADYQEEARQLGIADDVLPVGRQTKGNDRLFAERKTSWVHNFKTVLKRQMPMWTFEGSGYRFYDSMRDLQQNKARLNLPSYNFVW